MKIIIIIIIIIINCKGPTLYLKENLIEFLIGMTVVFTCGLSSATSIHIFVTTVWMYFYLTERDKNL